MTTYLPVVPGPPAEPALNGPCVACGSRTAPRAFRGELLLCSDAPACGARYRDGTSPETYAAGLRGELLAVAP